MTDRPAWKGITYPWEHGPCYVIGIELRLPDAPAFVFLNLGQETSDLNLAHRFRDAHEAWRFGRKRATLYDEELDARVHVFRVDLTEQFPSQVEAPHA